MAFFPGLWLWTSKGRRWLENTVPNWGGLLEGKHFLFVCLRDPQETPVLRFLSLLGHVGFPRPKGISVQRSCGDDCLAWKTLKVNDKTRFDLLVASDVFFLVNLETKNATTQKQKDNPKKETV